MGVADSHSLGSDDCVCYVSRIISLVDLLMFPFDVFGGKCEENSCNDFLSLFFGTLGSYLRDALKEGNANVVACLHVPRA
jgi:hypothetical protein